MLDFLGNNPFIKGIINAGSELSTNVGKWFNPPVYSVKSDPVTVALPNAPSPNDPMYNQNKPTPAVLPASTVQPQTTTSPDSSAGFHIPGVPRDVAQTMGQVFTGQGEPINATAAASILSHPVGPQVTGTGRGENPEFKTVLDIPNRIDPKTGQWNDNAPITQITNPFTGKQEDSVDRGLWRINNGSFYDYMRRMPDLLHNNGIYGWDDMKDTTKNTIMAKIIIQNQGGSAWFAAPADISKQLPPKQ